LSRPGRLFVLSGPSGAGKDTIIKKVAVLRPELFVSVSATTRASRPGEQHGKDYLFVSDDEFRAMRDRDDLLEWAVVHGCLYGTPRPPVERELAGGRDVLLEVDVQGAGLVKEAMPEAKLIFIEPPSWDVLVARLEERGTETAEALATRIRDAREQLEAKGGYDYVVVNDDADDAAQALIRILDDQEINGKD
jgi:guanylate kinase